MNAIKYQIIKINVPAPGNVVNINVNSDKLYKKITGMTITTPFTAPSLNQSSLSLQVNDKEIFPDGFEIRLLTCDQAVAVNERFFHLDEVADGSTIKGKFSDNNPSNGVFPYTVNIYLKLEEKQH
jgi:hypothetical protein